MKRLTKILFACAFVGAISACSLFAQVYTLDEFGNSTGSGISPGIVETDPSGGLQVPVLVYQLDFPVVTGDVLITGSGRSADEDDRINDVVRFWDPSGGDQSEIIFYSKVSPTDPPGAIENAGLPCHFIKPVILHETCLQANDQDIYSPASGAPGSIKGLRVKYDIITLVPEPGILTIVVVGGVLVFSTLIRRRPIQRHHSDV